MKFLKRTIIILLVLLIIVFICILIINKKTPRNEIRNVAVDRLQDLIKNMGLVEDYPTFFSVNKMFNDFMKDVSSYNKEAVYSILNNTYIEENNITKDNVLNKISDIPNYNDNVIIRKMYNQKNAENSVYYLNCIFKKENMGQEKYFVIYEDMVNYTYSIQQIDKETYENETQNTKSSIKEKRIEKNEYNKIKSLLPTEEEIADKYYKDFLENALYYPEYAYNLLDEEYKNKRFPTLQQFKKYIEDIRGLYIDIIDVKKINDFSDLDEYMLYVARKKNIGLTGYQIRKEEGYSRYICTDNYGKYYVFYAKSPLNYTIMLDTYTVDLPEFIEKYEKGTTEEKVGYNIEKIVNAINGKDYKYVYSKLDNEFKANNFKTYEDFEKYAKSTFDIANEVTYNKYTETKDLSTYQITLKGKNKTITKTIVMRLEEGTNFVMSFNVN